LNIFYSIKFAQTSWQCLEGGAFFHCDINRRTLWPN
jgi:hypothetical protein